MAYNARTGGGGIFIDYETRHPNKVYLKRCIGIAEFLVNNNTKEYDMILPQVEKIVIELNRLNDIIKSSETDLAMCQTPKLFNSVESKRVIKLERKLEEKDYEVNSLVNSLYRKSEEYTNEKEQLIKENFQLRSENNRCSDAIKAVREQELAEIPTSELAQELYSRLNKLDRLERRHSKLLMKHKVAANMIADLKEKHGGNDE